MKNIAIYIMIIIGIFYIQSCTKDSDRIKPSSDTTISFSLQSSFEKVSKTATDPLDNEKRIDRLDIFIYNQDGSTCLFYPEQTQLTLNTQTFPINVTLKIPASTMATLVSTPNCQVYVIANAQTDRSTFTGKTLAQVQSTVITNTGSNQFNTSTPPTNFLMEVSPLTGINFTDQISQNIGHIILKRAAAKITMSILSAKVTGYTPGDTRLKIVNYLNKTVIQSTDPQYNRVSGDMKTGSHNMISNNDNNHSYSSDPINPLYTYYNYWDNNISNILFTSYLIIEMDWTALSTMETKTYYYRVPLSSRDVNGNEINKIYRNAIYQFNINISDLGGISPEDALYVQANYDIIDWTTRTVETSILSYHYLFVYNPFIQLQNSNSYTWEYKSSLPVTFEITNVYSNYYTKDGLINTKTYTSADPQYPIITLNPVGSDNKTTFTVTSVIPINYVPLYITMNIKNGANLIKPVTLTIYPKLYVTAEYSYGTTTSSSIASTEVNGITQWRAGSYTTPTGLTMDVGSNNPDGSVPSGQINFNFFTVSVKSLDINDELDGYRIGDPTIPITHSGDKTGANQAIWTAAINPYYKTTTTVEGNKIISPEFVIATQRGITTVDKTWLLGQQRCNTYREGKYPAGTWRVPTMAELKLIRKMQLDANSAIKDLFQASAANGWWTAQAYWDIIVGQPNDATAFRSQTSTYKSNSVRCVHDVWRDN